MKTEARNQRNVEIHMLWMQGLSKAEIARAKRISEKQVARIIAMIEQARDRKGRLQS